MQEKTLGFQSKKMEQLKEKIFFLFYIDVFNDSNHINTGEGNTISPSRMFLRANRPHPCISDLPKQTRSFSVLWSHRLNIRRESYSTPNK